MAEAGLGFRTFTRAFINRYYTSGGSTLSTPIALPMPPESVELNPGVSLQKLKAKALQGATQTVFTYDEGREAILNMQFGAASAELEQLIIGRTLQADTNYASFVYREVQATATSIAAVGSTEFAYEVDEQTASGALTNGCKVFRINPSSGIAVPVTVIDYSGTPSTADQVAIGNNFALKFASAAVTANYTYYFKVPATFPNVTRFNSTVVTQVGVTLWGINFSGSATRVFNAQFCNLNYGASITAEPQRQIQLEITPDPTDGTGLGYNLIDLPLKIAA